MDITWIAEHRFDADRQPNLELTPVGRCIYCNAQDTKLNREHIWPDGLGGHLILPQSSCKACERLIDKFEQQAIRINFGLVRMARGIHSRKRRPGRLRATTYEILREASAPIDVPITRDMPQVLMAETPGRRASLISGQEPHPGRLVRHIGACDPRARMPAGYGITVDGYRSGVFPQLLAKIAHSYAVGCVGIEAFEAYLLNIISGREDPSRSRYLGDIEVGSRPKNGTLMRLGLARGAFHFLPNIPPTYGELFLVQICMFADLKLPIFEIVVGKVQGRKTV